MVYILLQIHMIDTWKTTLKRHSVQRLEMCLCVINMQYVTVYNSAFEKQNQVIACVHFMDLQDIVVRDAIITIIVHFYCCVMSNRLFISPIRNYSVDTVCMPVRLRFGLIKRKKHMRVLYGDTQSYTDV